MTINCVCTPHLRFRELVVTLVKVFVMTTLPMTQAAKDASRTVVNPQHSEELKKVLQKRKDNANKQASCAATNHHAASWGLI